MAAIESALLGPFVALDTWLRLGLPGGVALLVPALVLALAGALLVAVVAAAHRVAHGARLTLRLDEQQAARAGHRIRGLTFGLVREQPSGGRGPRAPGSASTGP
jgi:hypothetical protein